MADKENQWEDSDIEYSQSEEEFSDDIDESQNDDVLQDEDSYSDNEYDEEYDDDEDNQPKKNNLVPIIMIVLLLLLAGIVGFVLFSGKGSGSNQAATADNQIVQNQEASVIPQNPEEQNNQKPDENMGDEFFNETQGDSSGMMNVNFNESGETDVISNNPDGGEIVATVTNNPQNNEISVQNPEPANTKPAQGNNPELTEDLFAQDNNTIVVAYDKKTRSNPFKPPVVKSNDNFDVIEGLDVEIIEPPTTVTTDENLSKLLQTQISGILYDSQSPSAIVNLNGMDQFVKVGDTISGYKIQSITQNQVQISYKNNSYVASVGELFTKGALEKVTAVDNLENKFAGRYKN